MHEAGLAQTALELACSEAQRAGASAIRRIVLRVGRFAGVEPEALRFAYEALVTGTPAAGAMLELETVAARCRCAACGGVFEPLDAVFVCPACGALDAQWLAGRELELARVEVVAR
jgi:hydrogenase nickel incorporation protein HypA/HybF